MSSQTCRTSQQLKQIILSTLFGNELKQAHLKIL